MFNERTKEGVYKQQDADECFQLLVSSLEKVGISKVKKFQEDSENFLL